MKYALAVVLCLSAVGSAQTVGGGLPIPPLGATVLGQIQQMSGWQSCNDPSCAGGSGHGTYWMAQFQSQPSMSGSSMELFNSGVWANALWWKKLGSYDSATNLIFDFYFMVDTNAATAAQALEFEPFQFVNGYNYMIGSQCNIGAGVWDIWDELNGKWIHTNIACKGFTPNQWHHIQWYAQTNHSNQTYRYVTLIVDGVAYIVDRTYSAKFLNWSSNIGVQYQLDVNGTGQGYYEWVDNSTLTIW